MTKLTRLRVKGLRSIRDEVIVSIPTADPLVLVGENNAGKSNILRALEIILGERWPGTHEPEDHDFWDRNPSGSPIEIEAYFDGLLKQNRFRGAVQVHSLKWAYDPQSPGDKCSFTEITDSGEDRYVSSETREQCICLVVGPNRELSSELSYRSKYTLLSKLMRRFHENLVADPGRVSRLKSEFATVKGIFDEVSEFAEFQSGLREQFGEALVDWTYKLGVDFSAYDPSNFFHSLKIMAEEDGAARSLDEMGTGQAQVLALIFAHAYAKAFFGGIVLAIEEPEAHLHPLAQRWLARTLRNYTADSGLQVIVTTHSPEFVDILGLDGLSVVRKVERVSRSTQLTAHEFCEYCVKNGANVATTTPDTVLAHYAIGSTTETLSGLFARKVLLVEGQTEQFALPVYLGKVDMDLVRTGVATVPAMGKGNLAKWRRFYGAYGFPCFVVFDNDDDDDPDGSRRRDFLSTVNVPSVSQGDELLLSTIAIRETYAVFGRDFESSLRALFPTYEATEEEARQALGGKSKPLIARYVAERMPVDSAAGWESMRLLREKLVAITNP